MDLRKGPDLVFVKADLGSSVDACHGLDVEQEVKHKLLGC